MQAQALPAVQGAVQRRGRRFARVTLEHEAQLLRKLVEIVHFHAACSRPAPRRTRRLMPFRQARKNAVAPAGSLAMACPRGPALFSQRKGFQNRESLSA
ncbi:hypothetical protein D3C78_1363110 [compost metagenome]